MSRDKLQAALTELLRAVDQEHLRVLVNCSRGRIDVRTWDRIANHYGDEFDSAKLEYGRSLAVQNAKAVAALVLNEDGAEFLAALKAIPTLSRVVLVDHTSDAKARGTAGVVDREFWDVSVEVSVQDDGRTLKVFMRDPEPPAGTP